MAKASDISDLRILSLISDHDKNKTLAFAYEVLISEGIPPKVVYAKYDKLDRRGFLECGVSLRTGWLTEKGRAYLQTLREDGG